MRRLKCCCVLEYVKKIRNTDRGLSRIEISVPAVKNQPRRSRQALCCVKSKIRNTDRGLSRIEISVPAVKNQPRRSRQALCCVKCPTLDSPEIIVMVSWT